MSDEPKASHLHLVPNPDHEKPATVLNAEAQTGALRDMVVGASSGLLVQAQHVAAKLPTGVDPDGKLLTALWVVSDLRKAKDWEPLLSKLAKLNVNDLAEAVRVAEKHLEDYPEFVEIVQQLLTTVQAHREAYLPQESQLQREKANATANEGTANWNQLRRPSR